MFPRCSNLPEQQPDLTEPSSTGFTGSSGLTGLFAVKEAPHLNTEQQAFRHSLLPVLEEALQTGQLTDQGTEQTFRSDRPVTRVELMAEGYGSVVYRLLNDFGASQILKITESEAVVTAEAAFLDKWRDVGVRTPHVYHVGVLSGVRTSVRSASAVVRVPFLLMEYVSGETLLSLLDAGRVPEARVRHDLGMILARMHSVKAQGYGSAGSGHLDLLDLRDGIPVGRLASFQEQLASEGMPEAIRLAVDGGQIAAGDVPRVQAALAALDDHARSIGPALTHTDFRAGNVLYDPGQPVPYAVIDPYPTVTHPYLCLSYTMILDEIHTGRPATETLAGYSQVQAVDLALLQEALLLQSVLMSNFGQDPSSLYARNLRALFRNLRDGNWP